MYSRTAAFERSVINKWGRGGGGGGLNQFDGNNLSLYSVVVHYKTINSVCLFVCLFVVCLFVCLFVRLRLYVPVNNFSIIRDDLGLTGMKGLAQEHNTAPRVRIEPATLRSRVRRSPN